MAKCIPNREINLLCEEKVPNNKIMISSGSKTTTRVSQKFCNILGVLARL